MFWWGQGGGCFTSNWVQVGFCPQSTDLNFWNSPIFTDIRYWNTRALTICGLNTGIFNGNRALKRQALSFPGTFPLSDWWSGGIQCKKMGGVKFNYLLDLLQTITSPWRDLHDSILVIRLFCSVFFMWRTTSFRVPQLTQQKAALYTVIWNARNGMKREPNQKYKKMQK